MKSNPSSKQSKGKKTKFSPFSETTSSSKVWGNSQSDKKGEPTTTSLSHSFHNLSIENSNNNGSSNSSTSTSNNSVSNVNDRPETPPPLPPGVRPPPSLSPLSDSEKEAHDLTHCFICTELISWFAVGECDHRVCHICSVRLRALYKTKACALCKTELPCVIFTSSPVAPFSSYKLSELPAKDQRLKIYFDSLEIYEETMILLRFNCPDPNCDVACANGWGELKRHVKSKHGMLLCDICTRHKKIFTHEHALYTPASLKKHMKVGSADDPSFKGHPECAFCRQYFYGDDELFEHCRDKHEQCHLCVRLGVRNQYFQDYSTLEKHFAAAHFPCLEPECLANKFVVFNSDIDLKAHQLEVHSAGGKKVGRTQYQPLDVSFTFEEPSRRRRGGRGDGSSGGVAMGSRDDDNRNSSGRGRREQQRSPPRFNQGIPGLPSTSTPDASNSSKSAETKNPPSLNSQLQNSLRPPPGFGRQLTESSVNPDTPNGSGQFPSLPKIGSSSSNTKTISLSMPTSSSNRVNQRIRPPPGFGTELSNEETQNLQNISGSSSTSELDTSILSSFPPSVLSRLQPLLSSSLANLHQFQSLKLGYRNNSITAFEFLTMFADLVFNSKKNTADWGGRGKRKLVHEIGKVWNILAETAPDNKGSEMKIALRDWKIKQNLNDDLSDFPRPMPSSNASSSSPSPSSPSSSKVLVIKSNASRHQIHRTPKLTSSNSGSVWERMAEEMIAADKKEKIKFAESKASTSSELFPALPTVKKLNVWGSSSHETDSASSDTGASSTKKKGKKRQVLIKYG